MLTPYGDGVLRWVRLTNSTSSPPWVGLAAGRRRAPTSVTVADAFAGGDSTAYPPPANTGATKPV